MIDDARGSAKIKVENFTACESIRFKATRMHCVRRSVVRGKSGLPFVRGGRRVLGNKGLAFCRRASELAKARAKFEFPRSSRKIADLNTGETVVLNGWVDKKPKKMSKSLVFGNLRDSNGDAIQMVDNNEPSLIRGLKPESAIVASGQVVKRTDNNGNIVKDLQVDNIQVVNEAGIVGSQLTTGSTKDWPAEHRYLELRTSSFLQRNLQRRAKIMSTCRLVLDDLGFTEIETPLLFKSTPEGAREFLVPTRKKGYMYALPQSPQQYKQLLIASGVHRYYQIARCFRDEDLRQDRQPEFTQLDMEMGFAQAQDVQEVIEAVVNSVVNKVKNQPVYTMNSQGQLVRDDTFHKLTYREAIARFGIDKPDVRSSLEFVDISSYITSENPEFPVVDGLVLKNCLNLTDNTNIIASLSDARQYTSRIPTVVPITDETIGTLPAELVKRLDLTCGDVFAYSNRQELSYENPTPLGRLRQLAINFLPECYKRPTANNEPLPTDAFVANWVTDFPLFNPLETSTSTPYPEYDYKSYVTTHHPFTMAHLDDVELLSSSPLDVRGQHYDLVINGVEIGGGSTRIHDASLQKYIFDEILCISNSKQLFGHLLTALGTGCPPHAGLAIGFDRLTAMLSGTASIRDVIAFPKSITGADLMIGAPSRTSSDKLKPYHLRHS